ADNLSQGIILQRIPDDLWPIVHFHILLQRSSSMVVCVSGLDAEGICVRKMREIALQEMPRIVIRIDDLIMATQCILAVGYRRTQLAVIKYRLPQEIVRPQNTCPARYRKPADIF